MIFPLFDELFTETDLLRPDVRPNTKLEIDWDNHLSQGLVAYFPLNVSMGAADIVNKNNGTLVNNPIWVTSPRGPQLEFVTDDRIDIPDFSDKFGSEITVTAWAKSDVTTGTHRNIIVESYTSDDVLFHMGIGNDSDNNSFVAGFYNGSWREAVSPSTITAGQWYFLAATYDGTTVRLYVDGVEVATHSYSGTLPTGGSGWMIGKRHDTTGSNHHWDGMIESVGVYNRTLSPADIRDLYFDAYQVLKSANESTWLPDVVAAVGGGYVYDNYYKTLLSGSRL